MKYHLLAGLVVIGFTPSAPGPALAHPLAASVPTIEAPPPYVEVARRVVRRSVSRGPNVRRTKTVTRTNWRRPAHYRWRPGGAIAAGAAIGFVSAAAAAAWAGAPPAPGYCWYYTDRSRTRGFWDVCP